MVIKNIRYLILISTFKPYLVLLPLGERIFFRNFADVL